MAGSRKDIQEARNALRAYEMLGTFDVKSRKSFLNAHRVLMEGLLDHPGRWRRGNVGIQKGNAISHLAPPASRVPALMTDLFGYLRTGKEASLLILSCVFHYEISFIHPFMDGNGRVARLWQSALLEKYNLAFAYVPVESLVKHRQVEYYQALERSDKKGESTPFIEFMLELIHQALQEFIIEVEIPVRTPDTRLVAAQSRFGRGGFSRKDYARHFKNLSTATASRDLRHGVEMGLLEISGDKRTARYRFKQKKART